MLSKLSIQNYAIIEHLELSFSEQLSVITGETGAGKSIVMEALSLVLGERADQSILFNHEKKCIVEAVFEIQYLHLKTFFERYDLDNEALLTLRREVSSTGKSRAFINDTPVNVSVMKELGNQLVDMHTQQESQELNSTNFQLTLLDSLTKQNAMIKSFSQRYSKYQFELKKRSEINEQHIRESKELDYLNFQLQELSPLALKEGEQEQLEIEQAHLEHAEEIKQQLFHSYQLLEESENSVKQKLKEAVNLLSGIKKIFANAESLLGRIESCRIELEDISDELNKQQEDLQLDPEKLEKIQQRLDLIYRLQKKHHVNTVANLLQIENDLKNKIQSIKLQTKELEALDSKIFSEKKQLLEEAKKISEARIRQVPIVEKTVNGMLKEVGMPHAQIRISHQIPPEDQMNSFGLDQFRFLFASNKGSEFLDIRKIASGGELSRLMLCFKSLIASSVSLPTLIFDEIDSGISGETAVKVSRILKQLASRHQVICITHLPQLAAKGDIHYFVYKEIVNGRTFTHVRSLQGEEKIEAIARMISGEKITMAAMNSARELVSI